MEMWVSAGSAGRVPELGGAIETLGSSQFVGVRSLDSGFSSAPLPALFSAPFPSRPVSQPRCGNRVRQPVPQVHSVLISNISVPSRAPNPSPNPDPGIARTPSPSSLRPPPPHLPDALRLQASSMPVASLGPPTRRGKSAPQNTLPPAPSVLLMLPTDSPLNRPAAQSPHALNTPCAARPTNPFQSTLGSNGSSSPKSSF